MEIKSRKRLGDEAGEVLYIFDIVGIFPDEYGDFVSLKDFLEKADIIAGEVFEYSGFLMTKQEVEWKIENWYYNRHPDDEGGNHLFSPCECDDFSIELSSLDYGIQLF